MISIEKYSIIVYNLCIDDNLLSKGCVMPLKERKEEYLGAEFIVKEDAVAVTGTIDSASPSDFLRPFFQALHAEIVKERIKKIDFDITGLSYLNSSSIKEIVSWIILQKSLPEEDSYSINFICNPEYLWQESSISTVSFLNPGQITKELI